MCSELFLDHSYKRPLSSFTHSLIPTHPFSCNPFIICNVFRLLSTFLLNIWIFYGSNAENDKCYYRSMEVYFAAILGNHDKWTIQPSDMTVKPGQQSYQLHFSGFRLLPGQIIVWNLKLPSKTANLPSKMQNAVQKSWSNCMRGHRNVTLPLRHA